MSYRYIFTGTLHPERASFTLPQAVMTELKEDESQNIWYAKLIIHSNQVSIAVESETQAGDIYTLRNMIVNAASVVVDAFATEVFYAFDIEIRQVYYVEEAYVHTFGVDIPGLSPPEGIQADLGPHLQTASKTAYYSRAMGDFRRAMVIPSDTGFLCYRAFESLVNDFRLIEVLRDKKVAIDQLNDALKIAPECAEFLRRLGGGARHGHPASISAHDRHRALQIVQIMLKRFSKRYCSTGPEIPLPEFKLPPEENLELNGHNKNLSDLRS